MKISLPAALGMLAALLVPASPAGAQARATLNGVTVGAAGMPQANVTLVLTNTATAVDRRGVSEADGSFVFCGLQPGTYRLRTDDDRFAPFSQDQIVLAAGQTRALRIVLQPRVPTTAPPTARATLQGTVIGPDGRPRGNVTVILANAQNVDRRIVSEPTGAYIFGGLQPGAYRLRIEDAGADARPFAEETLTLAPGEQRQFDVRLQQTQVPPLVAPTAPLGPGRNPPAPDRSTRRAEPEVPEVTAPGGEFAAFRDRWQFEFPPYQRYQAPEKLPWVVGSPLDPYNQNKLKGDFPVGGNGTLFANINLQLNSTLNPRKTAVGAVDTQTFYNNNFVASAELFQGDTVFQPKNWAVRATIVGNVAGVTGNDPGHTYGVEELFGEKRLAVLSSSFDFMSVRAGVQNFNADFRGYLFQDNQLGVRLFGNAKTNKHQYNLVYFSMRQRDPGSQLHKFDDRQQDVLLANYFIQDFAVPGYTAMVNFAMNRDSKPLFAGQAGRLQVMYVGFHGDGRLGPFAVSHAFYQAFGTDDDSIAARVLSGNLAAQAPVDISAQMAAVEVARDADWLRYRGSFFYASGDDRSDPKKAHGFDAITDNPNLAGGQFMYWTQQATAVGTGFVSDKFSLLPNLRSKFLQRANFVNPGVMVYNGGVDMRVSPKLKVVTNVSLLQFADATVLQKTVGPTGGFEDRSIGLDIGVGSKYRPFVNENMFVVLGFATLKPNGGFATALGSSQLLYSFVGQVQLAF